jgi:uncharacterized repeat protein (TIGR01451 family)
MFYQKFRIWRRKPAKRPFGRVKNAIYCLFGVLCLFGTAYAQNITFYYSSVNTIHGIDLTAQTEQFVTTAGLSSAVNGFSVNLDAGIAYYGDQNSVYYWDPTLGTGGNAHVLMNNFSNGFLQAPINNINSTGGSYLNGKYYVGSEDDSGFVEEVYELEISPDGRQILTVTPLGLLSACGCTKFQMGGFGDLVAYEDGADTVLYGSTADLTQNGQGTSAGIWRFNLSNNSFTTLNSGVGGQLSRNIYGDLYTNVGNNIYELDPNTGATTGPVLFSTNNAIWDFSGGFSLDFGDAPDSYGSAIHLVHGSSFNVKLGSVAPDNETYTQNSAIGFTDGNGDDSVGIDDEDAVAQLSAINVGDTDYTVSISCTANAYVSAWIDFNLNGSFDVDERNSNYPVQCGSQEVELVWNGFDVATAGDSYMRMRAAHNLTNIYKPTGYFSSGEVEDHPIEFKSGNTGSVGNCPAGSVGQIYNSTDVSVFFDNRNQSSASSFLNVTDSVVITDVNVIDLTVDHYRRPDVQLTLIKDSTEVEFYDLYCNNRNDLESVSFDDEAAALPQCEPADNGVYRAAEALSAFDGMDSQGQWELRLSDSGRRRNRSNLEAWSIEICSADTTNVTPNPDIRLGKSSSVNDRVVTITLLARNTGNQELSNLDLIDNLDQTFGSTPFALVQTPQMISAPAGFSVNTNYTGLTNSDSLLLPSGVLQPGQEIQIEIQVNVGYSSQYQFQNQASVSAIDPTGTSLQDLSGSGLNLSTDSDEPTSITLGNTVTMSGVVFEDSSTTLNTSHDGIQQAQEGGLPNKAIQLIDVASGQGIGSAVTDATGRWSAEIGLQYVGQSIEVVVTPESDLVFISEAPLVTNADITDGRIIINPDYNETLNVTSIGVVSRPSLLSNQSSNANVGALVSYAHTYQSSTHGTLLFTIDSGYVNPTLDWSESLIRDNNCNQVQDSSDTEIIAAISVSYDEQVCVIASIEIPAGATDGSVHTLGINAVFNAADPAATGHAIDIEFDNADQTNIVNPEVGNLVLSKSVRNITLGGGAVSQNTALPGHMLEYAIRFANDGNGPITDLIINDEIPAFTTNVNNSAQCVQAPQPLVCTPIENGAQISWHFQGALSAGDSGVVSYRVLVD